MQAISIKEARKVLGAESKSLSDAQVLELIVILTEIAQHVTGRTSSKNTRSQVYSKHEDK